MRRVLDWLEDRTGIVTAARGAITERIPGGPRWAYVFGSGLAITFGIQMLTGVLLAFHFSPSATDAWGSVYYIQNQVTLGWLLRGLHHFGSSAMIVLLALHMVQVVLAGAYKAPREVNWLLGVGLLGLVLALSLTGYLLPWDQKGYWATKVATNIMGGLPVVGESIQTLAQGGSEYGNATLTRFYALHVFVLPGLVIGLIGAHVALFRRHGVTPPASKSHEELERTAGWFWPTQVLLDATFGLAVLAVLVILAITLGAPLGAPADASSDFDARPEWYFLFLFQLLKYFEGPLVLIGTVVLPGLASVFLVLLPFLDKGESRRIGARKVWVGLFMAGLLGVGALTAVAWAEDTNNESFQKKQAEAERNAREAVAYAGVQGFGIDAHGKVVLYEGKSLFRREQCGQCHEVEGIEGEDPSAPSLNGFLSRPWLDRFLKNPSHPKHFGRTKLAYDEDEGTGMPAPEVTDEQRAALVEFLASLTGDTYDPALDPTRVAAGAKLFDDECSACHTLDGTVGMGPTLEGYGSRDWLAAVIRHPSAENLYGELGDGMPPFDHLSDAEIDYLTAWLSHLKEETRISE